MAKTVRQYKDRLNELKREKSAWLELFQLIGKYVHQRKVNFTENHLPGEFLVSEVFASTASKAARRLAQLLVGMIWQGGKSIRLKRPQGMVETAENKEYFQKASENVQEDLDDTRNGLTQALSEDMFDQVTFGTAGIGTYEGTQGALLDFMAFGVDECTLDENAKGKVDTMYCERNWNVRKVVQEYGLENASARVRDWFNKGRLDEKVTVVWVIEPREFIPGMMMKGNMGMPIASLHFELESEKILRKSGYEEMPVEWERFYKQRNEKYGRSPTTDALADIFEENFTKEARIVATEKAGDPPVVVMDDGVGGAGIIDTSAGGVIVANTKGRATSPNNPIYPLFEGMNIPQMDKTIEELKGSLMEHYLLDRLLDTANETEMTLGEVQLRDTKNAMAMNEIFTKQQTRLRAILERAIAILYRKGRMGVFKDSLEAREAMELGLKDVLIIPDDVAQLIRSGKEFYTIEFLTPAARLLKAEQAKGTMQVWEFALTNREIAPEMIQKLDPVASMEVVGDAWGAPGRIFRSDKQVQQIQQQVAKAQEQQRLLQEAQQGADVVKTVTEASREQVSA